MRGEAPNALIPDKVLRDIAKLTGVEEVRRRQMRLTIRGAVDVATMSWRRGGEDPFGAAVRGSVRPLKRLALDLRDGLTNLDETARRVLTHCLEDEEEGYRLVPVDDGRRLRPITISDYVELLGDLAQASDLVVRPSGLKTRRPGAPKGTRTERRALKDARACTGF
jgi:hypothetical protein